MIKMIASMLCLLALVACNTVRGVGQDVEKAGEAVQNSTK